MLLMGGKSGRGMAVDLERFDEKRYREIDSIGEMVDVGVGEKEDRCREGYKVMGGVVRIARVGVCREVRVKARGMDRNKVQWKVGVSDWLGGKDTGERVEYGVMMLDWERQAKAKLSPGRPRIETKGGFYRLDDAVRFEGIPWSVCMKEKGGSVKYEGGVEPLMKMDMGNREQGFKMVWTGGKDKSVTSIYRKGGIESIIEGGLFRGNEIRRIREMRIRGRCTRGGFLEGSSLEIFVVCVISDGSHVLVMGLLDTGINEWEERRVGLVNYKDDSVIRVKSMGKWNVSVMHYSPFYGKLNVSRHFFGEGEMSEMGGFHVMEEGSF